MKFTAFPTVTVLLAVLLITPSLGQDKIPDTPAGKRLAELIAAISASDQQEREKGVVAIFSKEKEPARLYAITERIYEDTKGLVFQKVVESSEFTLEAICEAKNGIALAKLTVNLSEEGDHLITSAGFTEYEPEPNRVLTRVGDYIPIMGENGQTIEVARGVWLAEGYGYIAEITNDEMRNYCLTQKYGWPSELEVSEMNLYFVEGDSKETARITVNPKEHGYDLVRLPEVPAVCRESDWTPTKTFDAFVDVMETHYPFFEVRDFDWQAKVATHRPRVKDTMSELELFDVMKDMLTGLGDVHTSLSADIDGKTHTIDTGYPATIVKVKEAMAKEGNVPAGIPVDFIRSIRNNIFDKVLDGKGKKCCRNQIAWGYVDENIGFISVYGMGGYSRGTKDEQIEALHQSLDEILTEFANTDAIIFDITTNFGGEDVYGMEIASHFADQKRLGYSGWSASAEKHKRHAYVTPYRDSNPDGVMYFKPVFLVTSDMSVSAAESFAMYMRPLPSVTTVGEATNGALSDMLEKPLPNGWTFYTSNEIYVDHEGVCYEGKGIPPDMELKIFDQDNVRNIVHHKTIQKVIDLAKQKISANQE